MKKIGILLAMLLLISGCGKGAPHITPTIKPTDRANPSRQPLTMTITPRPTIIPATPPKPPMSAKELRLAIKSTISSFSKDKDVLTQVQRTLPAQETEGALMTGFEQKDGKYRSVQINYDNENSQISCEYYPMAGGLYVYQLRKDFDADLVKQSIYWVSQIQLNEYFITAHGAWRFDRTKDELIDDESAMMHNESYQSYIDTLQSQQNPT